MNVSINIDLGIREIRQLISFIKEKHGVDYTEYTLTSFKRRVEIFLSANKYGLDMLLMKLESKEFLDHFAGCIAVSATELFRDPTFWILLKNIYIANIIKDNPKAKIWLPMCASGEEFYSLAILLKESGWIDRVEIFVSGMSNEVLESIKSGQMEYEKLEISTKNYSRFQGASQLADYYEKSNNDIKFDRSLFTHTQFFKEGLELDHDLPYMHLILFRNQLIYFNPTLQYKVCDILYNKLTSKGLLALGILEEMEMTFNNRFITLNKEESIFQRRS
jgi:chemotaxis protein methyltransferase CheR